MTTTKITLKSLLASKRLDWVNPSITEDVFPLEAVRSSDYKLYHFDKYISSEDAVKEMEKDGYIPANIHELLLWKDWNDNDLVVALGSVGKVRGHRRLPYLYRLGSKRVLNLGWWDGDWFSCCRFLAVRNLSSEAHPSAPALGNLDTLARLENLISEAQIRLDDARDVINKMN